MRGRLAVVGSVFLALVTTPVAGQAKDAGAEPAVDLGFASAGAMIDDCLERVPEAPSRCAHYVAGLVDGLVEGERSGRIGPTFCLPADVDLERLTIGVVRWLVDAVSHGMPRAEYDEMPAGQYVHTWLVVHYPCEPAKAGQPGSSGKGQAQ